MLHQFALLAAIAAAVLIPAERALARPNVILIMTDDQGYGDLGVNGNPIIRTPNIDALSKKSAVLPNFYVSPVCTPTRASLMTGRYNYRTRAIDTFRGRAMMDTSEVTVAELLKSSGYATGIFGKWHLGDCYPMRPMDQGFEMSLVHRGGGIGQPSDPPGAENKYTDPILFRNGQAEQTKGYCTDVYFREGLAWAEKNAATNKPFFLYLPTNCPHGPFGDVPPTEYDYYKSQKLSADQYPKTAGNPIPRNYDTDTQARVNAMIDNIDQNVGRLLKWLDEKNLADNTLVIFLTDNGRATPGYNAGLRGNKTTVFEGGIKSPFFAYWPGKLQPGVASERIAMHIDLAPTILEICGVTKPADLKQDGRSIWPLLTQTRSVSEGPASQPTNWPDRTLFSQSHRGDEPVLYHNFAARNQNWKLVSATGFGLEKLPVSGPKFELFDMQSDPYELHDVASEHPDIVAKLKSEYEAWFKDVGSTRPDNYAPPRIIVGSPHEKTTVLTRQDWRGAAWGPTDEGHWEINVASNGPYDVKLIVFPADTDRTIHFRCGSLDTSATLFAKATEHIFKKQQLPIGDQKLEAWIDGDNRRIGVRFVELAH
ncbi:MAG TPA: arylsulfatase [Pirellulaceae bacterium]